MKNKLLLPLLLLLVVGVFVIWQVGGAGDQPQHNEVVELAPGSSSALSPGALGDSALPDMVAPAAVAPLREEVAALEEEPKAVATSPREAPKTNALWVKGRVIFPDHMPNDIGEVTVTARGRRFSDKDDSRREHEVTMERDGSFRVAFSKSTKKGWLDVRGRYLYLPEKIRLIMDELPDELLVEPELGGVVIGSVNAPVGSEWNEKALEGAHVQINSWSRSNRVSRRANLDTDGGFQLTGVPPGNSYNLQVKVPLWSDANSRDVEVRSGEKTELQLEVLAGSSIVGQVVNQEGVGRAGVNVELSGDPTDGSWLHATTQTDEEGGFAFYGVKDAEVTIKAVLDEYLPVEQDLGYLPAGSRRNGLLLTIDEGNVISGVVQWPDGTPVSGAWVSVSQERETEGLRFMFDDAATEKSEADGTFRISGLEPSVCVVRASAKSFRKKEMDKAKERAKEGRDYTLRARGPMYKVRVDEVRPGTSGLVLILEKGDSLSGKVVDDEGTGLTNFVVSAEPAGGAGSDLEREDSINRVVVSLDGNFTIDGLQDGNWKIRAKAKGHQQTESIIVTSPGAGEVELVANRYSEIQGVVRSPGGEPISGARIHVDHLNEDEEFKLEQITQSWGEDATTNQRGEFTAREVRAGRVRISASAEGFGSSQGVLVQPTAGESVEGVTLQLRQAARIRGQLHASVGNLEGRRISVRAESGGRYWNNATSDSSGRFELKDLDAGSYRLTLEKEEGQGTTWSSYKTVAVVVDVDAGEQTSVVLGAPPSNPTTVSGRVTSAGKPLPGVLVSCRSQSGGDFNNDAVQTDSDGAYNLSVAGGGSYSFRVGDPSVGLTDYERELSEGANPNTDFVLSNGRISGAVTGMDGQPKRNCDISLTVVKLEEDHSRGSTRRVTTDDQGNYEIDYVEAGEYYMRVNENRTRWSSRTKSVEGTQVLEGLKIAEGSAMEGVNFELQEAGTIEGSVTGVDGMPANRATIRVHTLNGNRVHSNRTFRTNSAGSFEYERLGEGRYRVSAELNGARSEEVEVRVQPGSANQVELTLKNP